MATNHKNFQDNLKKYFYSGVGLASHTAEILQKSMKELSRKGKVSEADGKRIIKDAMKKVEARRPEIEAKYNATVHKFVKATTTEMSKLQKRIQQLEGQLKTKNNTPAASQPRTASAKKRTTGKTKSTAKRTTPVKPTANVDSPATENRTDSASNTATE